MKIKKQGVVVAFLFMVGVCCFAETLTLNCPSTGNGAYTCSYDKDDGAPACDQRWSDVASDCIGAIKKCCNINTEKTVPGK